MNKRTKNKKKDEGSVKPISDATKFILQQALKTINFIDNTINEEPLDRLLLSL